MRRETPVGRLVLVPGEQGLLRVRAGEVLGVTVLEWLLLRRGVVFV